MEKLIAEANTKNMCFHKQRNNSALYNTHNTTIHKTKLKLVKMKNYLLL